MHPLFFVYTLSSVDVGPHRDLVGDLTNSVRAAGLHMGLYHSLREWYNPLFLEVCLTSEFDSNGLSSILVCLQTLSGLWSQIFFCCTRVFVVMSCLSLVLAVRLSGHGFCAALLLIKFAVSQG